MAPVHSFPLGVQISTEPSPLEEILEDLQHLGCSVLELHTGVPRFHPDHFSKSQRRVLRQLFADAGLHVTLHAPESLALLLPFREQVQGTLGALQHLAQFAEDLGAATITLHIGRYTFLGSSDGTAPMEMLEPHDAYREAFLYGLDHLDSIGFPISIENAGSFHVPWVLAILEHGLPDTVGLTLDIGHLHLLQPPLRDRVFALFERFSDRIQVVHLHDNDGTHDQHLPPGEGTVPFASIFRSLALSSPPLLVLEVRPYTQIRPRHLDFLARQLPYNLATNQGGRS